jgi:dTDP-4-amino-4,6-dideoxygalactose transaminase
VPYKIVRQFEETIAEYAGSKFAVAVESCSAAIFLSCLCVPMRHGVVTIPRFTYPSVPASILHAGGYVDFSPDPWRGVYKLEPYSIVDGALRFRRGMYQGGLHCLSFHAKKLLPIGRGGMILTDDEETVRWFRIMRFDGREERDLSQQQVIHHLGWNMYMQPEQAARGLLLFNMIKNRELEDLDVEAQGYPDLSRSEIYYRREEGGGSFAICT